jgi:hypothetical protein
LAGFRIFLGLTIVLGFLALIDQRHYADEIAVWAVSPYWRWGLRFGALFLACLSLLTLSSWTRPGHHWMKLLGGMRALTRRLGILRAILPLVLGFVFPALILGGFGRFFLPFFTRLFVFWMLVSIASWFASSWWSGKNPLVVLTVIALAFASLHRMAMFLADLGSYPFSLSWSEASRYYYASLFLSERIYGVTIPPSILHPTRYLMQSLAFLIPGAGLSFHRAWQVAIWTTTSALTGLVLAKRLELDGKWNRLLFILWVFLFLYQGPVYYHLLIMVITVIWTTRAPSGWWTLLIVVLTSAWAGISRVNWVPVPAMLAALLYFLERGRTTASLYRYLSWPAIWFGVGVLTGLASQSLYLVLSGNDPSTFGSSLSSQLVWYRLLPSATYPLGVLPAILLAILPACLIWVSKWKSVIRRTAWIRLLGIASILTVLFVGGILVSVKIGGGSNLHNMDAFLVAILLSTSYLVNDKWKTDDELGVASTALHPAALVVAIWMPVSFVLGGGMPIKPFDRGQAQRAMGTIQSTVDRVTEKGEEILFISQRHLLTFGQIEGVEIVPEYETVFLMEMAMSRTRPYLDQFHADLAQKRFGLIIVDRLSTQLQGRDHDFAEENNAWVEEVSTPILCYYKELASLGKPPLQFLVPSISKEGCSS